MADTLILSASLSSSSLLKVVRTQLIHKSITLCISTTYVW